MDPQASPFPPRATSGQSGFVARVFDHLSDAHEARVEEPVRMRIRSAMRAARWWSVATARLDMAELRAQTPDARIDEALEADLIAYYLFGAMVTDCIAAMACGVDLDIPWVKWLDRLDQAGRTTLRDRARELDLMLRVPRDKLAVHIDTLSAMSVVSAGPGTLSFGMTPVFPWPSTGDDRLALRAAVQRHGGVVGDLTNIHAAIEAMAWLRQRAADLGRVDRDVYRRWVVLVGLHTEALAEVTWRIVELCREVCRTLEPARGTAAG